MRLLLILVVLVGCASTQHKHPHDHGLSAIKGRMNQINSDINNLLNSILALEIEIVTNRNKLTALDSKTKEHLVIIESDILEIERLYGIHNEDVSELRKEVRKNKIDLNTTFSTDTNRRKALLADIKKLSQRLKIVEQHKFIDLNKNPCLCGDGRQNEDK